MDSIDMTTKLDPFAEGFLHTCYKAGMNEAQATAALVKCSAHNLRHHGTPLDNVSRTVFAEAARLQLGQPPRNT